MVGRADNAERGRKLAERGACMLRIEGQTEPAIMLAIGVKLTRAQVAEIKLAAALFLGINSLLVLAIVFFLGGAR